MAHHTLPHQLLHQAEVQPERIALRHKQLGIWHQQRWQALRAEIGKLVEALSGLGFRRGDTLVLLTHPRREALLLSLAAQWLGGIAAPVDPDLDIQTLDVMLGHMQAGFVFAEGQEQVDHALAHGASQVIYADARGLAAYAHTGLHAYQPLLQRTPAAARQPVTQEDDVAFSLYRLNGTRQVQVEYFRHAELLLEGRYLVGTEHLGRHEEAFAARVFAASGHLRYLLAPWLVAGFTLNFPENIVTRDADRRELGPTLVVGTRETYQRLEEMVRTRLPAPDSVWGRFVHQALQADGSILQQLLAYWLVKRPLRDVIGFSRIRVPLLIGPALSQESLHFFHSLGIHIRSWNNIANWHSLPTTTSRKQLAGTQEESIRRAAS